VAGRYHVGHRSAPATVRRVHVGADGRGHQGASPRDGVDTGGLWIRPRLPYGRGTTDTMPGILCTLPQGIPDSGGAGKYRGGNAAEWAFIADGSVEIKSCRACGCADPTSRELWRPGALNEYSFVGVQTCRGTRARPTAHPTGDCQRGSPSLQPRPSTSADATRRVRHPLEQPPRDTVTL